MKENIKYKGKPKFGFKNPEDYLRVDKRLEEFETEENKFEARVNIDSQVIDQDEY